MRKAHGPIVVAAAVLLTACAPARQTAAGLTHSVIFDVKRQECLELPAADKQNCLDRVKATYWTSEKQAAELRRQLDEEGGGEDLPEMIFDDRM